MRKILPYAKAVVAVLGAVAVVVQAALTDDAITTNEWIKIGFAVVTAGAVFLTPAKGYVNTGGKTEIVTPISPVHPAGEDGLGGPLTS